MSRFVLTLKTKTEIFQKNELNTRFEVARLIYNSCLRELEKRERNLKQSKIYHRNIKRIKAINLKLKRKTLPKKMKKLLEKDKKTYQKEIYSLQKKFHLTDASIQQYINKMKYHFNGKFDIDTIQKVASRAFESWEKRFLGKSKKIHYKKYGEMDTLESKKSSSGIRFKQNTLYWLGLEIPVLINEKNSYEKEALQHRICYCRIKRQQVRGKTKFYLQLVLEGIPPKKRDPQTGMFKHRLGTGTVGIDIGTSTIAVVGDEKVFLTELAPHSTPFEKELRRKQRKVDRSRRATNPSKFKEDGTIHTQNKDSWFQSNRYKQLQNEIKELHRKSAAVRKLEHCLLSNQLLSYGNHFKVEHMNFQGLAKRSKETKINEKTGKFQKKKRFGKSIANKTPKLLLNILKNKVESFGGTFDEVNTWKVKASQMNHLTGEAKKKKLSKRWHEFEDGTKVQRDLYSGFLIQQVKENLEEIDLNLCQLKYDHFKHMHDEEMERIKKLEKTPTSMGV